MICLFINLELSAVEIDMKLIILGINIKNLKPLLVFCKNYFFNYDHYAYISHKGNLT